MKFAKILPVLAAGIGVMFAFLPLSHAAPYTEAAVANGGRIAGKLSFTGALPADAVEKIAINKNPEICDEDKTGHREVVWVDVKDGALRGAFVFIDDIKQGKKWGNPETGNYMVLQKGCRFRPWAQVVKPGDITIRHDDPSTVLHNINAREMIGVEKGQIVKKTLFNFGQPDPGDIKKQLQPKRSHFVSLNCEAHNFMFGFMLAPEHPYAVVVKEDGSYSLDDVPPGTYTVKAWHPRLGLKEAKVTVAAKGKAEANFAFSSK